MATDNPENTNQAPEAPQRNPDKNNPSFALTLRGYPLLACQT